MSFIRNGAYSWGNGSLLGRRSSGYYWSSRAYSGTYANYLSFYDSTIYPRNGYSRGNGFSVRCVASWVTRIIKSEKCGSSNLDSIVHNVPMSFIRNGYYYCLSGYLYGRRSASYFWSAKAYSDTGANYSHFHSSAINPRTGSNRGDGFTIRCGAG